MSENEGFRFLLGSANLSPSQRMCHANLPMCRASLGMCFANLRNIYERVTSICKHVAPIREKTANAGRARIAAGAGQRDDLKIVKIESRNLTSSVPLLEKKSRSWCPILLYFSKSPKGPGGYGDRWNCLFQQQKGPVGM